MVGVENFSSPDISYVICKGRFPNYLGKRLAIMYELMEKLANATIHMSEAHTVIDTKVTRALGFVNGYENDFTNLRGSKSNWIASCRIMMNIMTAII